MGTLLLRSCLTFRCRMFRVFVTRVSEGSEDGKVVIWSPPFNTKFNRVSR